MKFNALLGEWKAPENELSRKARIMSLPNMYTPHDYGKAGKARIEKVAVRSSATGKVYGSKAIAQRVIDSEDKDMESKILKGAMSILAEKDEREKKLRDLKKEKKSIKKQLKGLKKEIKKVHAAGGGDLGHPFIRGALNLKAKKKEIKKQIQQLGIAKKEVK